MSPIDHSPLDAGRGLTADAFKKALALCEGGSGIVDGQSVAADRSLAVLADIGVLSEAGVAQSLECMDCVSPHQVDVEFDPATSGYRAFCSNTGSIEIDTGAALLFRFNADVLLSWLAGQFHVPSSYTPIELVSGQLWELGEGHVLQHRLHVFFARDVGSVSGLDRVQSRLEMRKNLSGLVVTSSPSINGPIGLRYGFSMVSAHDILKADQTAAEIDLRRAMSMTGSTATVDAYSTGLPGRPTSKHLILKEFENIIGSKKVRATLAEQAEELRIWIAENHPDAQQPKLETIKNVIREKYRIHKPQKAIKL